ncbi:carbon-nitrogen hydrolase family protein, partial [bacterium]|nr:carbon-nitrogen hydrolase family protein [bacterium]
MAIEYRRARKIEDNLRYIEDTFSDISNIKPDLVCLPEIFYYTGINIDERKNLYDKEIKLFLRNLSSKYKTYIAASVYEKRKGNLYNTCLFLNRKGEIVGRYDKIHPTELEIEKGIKPGSKSQKPVRTEFGLFAAQICFDANWREEWERFVRMGVKLIVFSSAYPGGKILNSIALLNNVYIVASTWALKTGIVDNTGNWMVKTDRFSWWVWREVNLEREVFHWDFQGEKIRDILKEYREKIKIETFGDEALFTIEPISKDIKIKDIVRKYKLVTYREYIERATKVQDKFR